jgi:sulfide:quinone oxidoreductase
LHVGTVAAVNGRERWAELADERKLPYDAVVIAVGAKRVAWLEGATLFGGADDVPAFGDLLARLERGALSRLAFVAPAGTAWTLPMYELALLTASRVADRGIAGVELTVLTPEADPLEQFGAAASRMLRDQLGDRGIRLRAGATVVDLAAGRLELASGEVLDVDEVVALARLEGPRLQGLPADGDGFIRIDELCRVPGLPDVYAAGDGASYPVKQGGLATQQADVAAEAIAAGFGAAVKPSPFEPMLRGLLLTGVAPMYLRAGSGAAPANGEVAANALWWPPTKIAGRYLGPYLACVGPLGETELEHRGGVSLDPAALQARHRDARDLALAFAEADARTADFRSALRWLEVVEQLDGVLPRGYLERRDAWRMRA